MRSGTPRSQTGAEPARPRSAASPTSDGSDAPVDRVATFEAERGRLFGLAYRMLGSAADAEDVVQEAFLRWNDTDGDIAAPPAWLTKVTTNLCLTQLTSARARRENYVGPWLPEPVCTDDETLGPLDTVERRDSVSMALLVVLENLAPVERAVFVLREAFSYAHRDIAEVLEISEPNSRQIHRRARARIADAGGVPPRYEVGADEQRQLVQQFLAAAQDGDLETLEAFLVEDAVSYSDGGGKVSAGRYPVRGRSKIARLYAGIADSYLAPTTLTLAEVNGEPAVLFWSNEQLWAVGILRFTVDGRTTRIAALHAVINPDKLGRLKRQVSHVSHERVLLDQQG